MRDKMDLLSSILELLYGEVMWQPSRCRQGMGNRDVAHRLTCMSNLLTTSNVWVLATMVELEGEAAAGDDYAQ